MNRVGALLCCVAPLLIGIGGTVLADAKDDAEKALLGKWEQKAKVGGKEVTLLLTFEKGGKLSMKVTQPGKEITGSGTFKVVDANHFEISLTAEGQTKSEKNKFKVDKDSLELRTLDDKFIEKFTRVK
jgi:uncharacterized protein (TIGR03066 family)